MAGKKTLFFIICYLIFHISLSAQNITVSGHLYERGSLESLPGGLIYEPVSQTATTTNTYGFYTLTLPYCEGMYLVFNSFGYINDTLWIRSAENVEYDARLSKITMLETVTIKGEKTNTEQVQIRCGDE